MKITIERAEPKDALALIAVYNLCFRNDFEQCGECPAYQEKPEDIVRQIELAIVYKVIE